MSTYTIQRTTAQPVGIFPAGRLAFEFEAYPESITTGTVAVWVAEQDNDSAPALIVHIPATRIQCHTLHPVGAFAALPVSDLTDAPGPGLAIRRAVLAAAEELRQAAALIQSGSPAGELLTRLLQDRGALPEVPGGFAPGSSDDSPEALRRDREAAEILAG